MAQVNQLPRPLLFALVGAAAVAAVMFATRRGGTDTASTSAPAAQSQSGSKSATQAGSGSGSSGARSGGSQRAGSPPTGLPSRVERALDANKVVVLLFWNRRGSDDQAVKQGVDAVSTRGGKVAKFTDGIDEISRYTKVTGTQAVTQSPALVVVDRDGKAQVATGFLDAESVDQLVVDALR